MVRLIPFRRYETALAGFGLVELMIALALGTIIILGVTTLFSDSSRALNDINRAGRQLENGLYAIDLLAKELALVDYWGEASAPVDADDPAYGALRASELDGLEIGPYPASPPLCVGTGITGFDPRVELAWAMESPLLSGASGDGSDLNEALDNNYCKGVASAPADDSAYLAVRRASTCATGVGSIATNNACREVDDFFYLQTNGCYDENAGLSGGEVKLYRAGSADIESLLTYSRYQCDPSDRAPIYRYVSRIYYINQSDQLVRLFLDSLSAGDHGYVQEILVDGVEDLQFEWFLDDSGDGIYDRKVSEVIPADAANVIGAKIWLKVRSPQDARPSSVHSRVVSLPNRVGRRR